MSAQTPGTQLSAATAAASSLQLTQAAGSVVAQFEIRYHQYLDHLGKPVRQLPAFASNAERLVEFYRTMLLTRLFDQKAVALQRTGQLGTYASSLGQEAIGVAIGSAMRPDDVLLPAYREYGAQFLRGVSMTDILLYWGGDERGMDYKESHEDFPICVPVASQSAHAVGVAFAIKYRKEPRVAVCVLGDGGTSKGDFYEALNLAGVWKLPVLFVVSNNEWAISVPRDRQSAAKTLAQKAIAAGITGEQVDGNDIIALYDRIHHAIEEIRNDSEPVLIEALTYRMCDHTTADDASRYRSEEEVEAAQVYDPLTRLKQHLLSSGQWSDAIETQLGADCTARVEAAVKAYLDTPPQPPESMFDFLYEQVPDMLKDQREHARRRKADG